MSETQEVLYHYTTGTIFRKILKQGAILPDRSDPDNQKEIPTVTFSSDPEWERTRYRVGRMPNGQLILMNKELLQKFDNGLIRIVVPRSLAPLDWHAMKDKIGMTGATIQGIYDFAVSVGARTRNWYGTTESVPEEVWITVEKYTEGKWIELPEEEIPDTTGEINESAVVEIAVPVVPVLEAQTAAE